MALDLHRAAQKGDIFLMNQLLSSKKVVVDKRDPYGGTPFHWACQAGQIEAINWLVTNGADVHSIATYEGKNALHFAIESKQIEVVRCLLGHGVDPSHKDNSGKTPRESAEKMEFFDVLLVFDTTQVVHSPSHFSQEGVQKRSNDQFKQQQQYPREFFPQQKMDGITTQTGRYQAGEHLPSDNIATKMRQEGRWQGPSSSSPSPSPSPSVSTYHSPVHSPSSFSPSRSPVYEDKEASFQMRLRQLEERERRVEERERDVTKREEDLTRQVEKFREIVKKKAMEQRAQQ